MDPYGQQHGSSTSMSPNDFFQDLHQHHSQSQTPILQAQQPSIGPRQYKSRKFRPCDFCRARQVACKIETAPPCNLCLSHNRECTFVEQPKKKRRPNPGSSGDSLPTPTHTRTHSAQLPNGGSIHNHEDHVSAIDPALANLDQSSPSHHHQHQHRHSLQLNDGYMQQFNEHVFDPQLIQENQFIDPQIQAFSQSPLHNHYSIISDAPADFSRPSPNNVFGSQERPLDFQPQRSARFIGETGESNPYLLRHYRYDENDECTISKLTYRRIRRSSQQPPPEKGEPPVVFMLADDSMAVKGEPRVEDDVLSSAQRHISAMFSEEEALRIIALYFRFINPYFQILPRSQVLLPNGSVSINSLRSMPLSLLAAIYATALPFMLYDDLLSTTTVHNPPSAAQLYRYAWLSIQQELHTPRLATLQACLLLLQRPPTNRYTTDTPWKTSLVGWTVSLAQSLGLSHDCSDWNSIPQWEIMLRRRLWWAVYIMDKWASVGAGMPSHIHPSDYDVAPLTTTDCEDATEDAGEANGHFKLLSELTVILDDTVDSYYTIQATKRTSASFALSLELAWPLRSRLKSWNDSLPPAMKLRRGESVDDRGRAKLSGNPALSLAYIVATMTLFRALLRPLQNIEGDEDMERGIEGSINAAKEGARACAREVVEFVEGLGRGSLSAFWHSWSRSNFAIASSFLMQLHITAASPIEKEEIDELISRWRWAMRIGSGATGGVGGGLMSLGLLRMDGLMREERAGDDGAAEARRNTVG